VNAKSRYRAIRWILALSRKNDKKGMRSTKNNKGFATPAKRL
jgi:hypothetical protein